MARADIEAELTKLQAEWDSFRKKDDDDGEDEGYGGSPGESMVERMEQLATALKRKDHQ